jgi:hypothetical protein
MMDPPEIKAMRAVLNERRPRRVLEWGSGGSTMYWPRMFPLIDWVSIEHNPDYAQALKGKITPNVTLKQLDFPDYHELRPDQVGMFDLIIVDGRKRVRCLEIGRDLLVHGGAVLLHDAGRERYATARKYYQTITVLSPAKKARDPRGLWLLTDPRPTKIFGVGLSKTGTNSLNVALERLGYKALHYPSPRKVLELAQDYDALTDTPVLHAMEALDHRYPGALFVLTTREIESWLVSCQGHWQRAKLSDVGAWNRVNVYGTAEYDEATFRQVYAEHNQRIRDYFAARPWKLVELDITNGEGYEKLCPALGLPVLNEPFPHESAAPGKESQ